MPRHVLIANPGTKRCEAYRRELLAFGADRGEAADVEVVPWADIALRDGNLDGVPAFDRPAIVHLESPGKDDRAIRLMLEAGARDASIEVPAEWPAAVPRGLLLRPGLWYRGFCRVLRGLRQSFDGRPHLTSTACPLAVAEMFDKTATSRKLGTAGVPVPESLDLARFGSSAAAVIEAVRSAGWASAYMKLNCGSSAVGIIALDARGDRVSGVTSLAEIDGQFFSSRELRRLEGDGLHRAIDFLLGEGAVVQRGIPKAQVDGQPFDLRVVCLYAKPAASIFRLSSAPMTNLHLGGRRGDFARCRRAVPTRDWLDALGHCAEAAGCFDSAVAGVDLVFERGFARHYVLEVNAFGDFFPGWQDAHGRSLHRLEIETTAARFG